VFIVLIKKAQPTGIWTTPFAVPVRNHVPLVTVGQTQIFMNGEFNS